MENHDVHCVAVTACLDSRRTGVARRGADDGDPLAPPGQFMVEQTAQQLEGHVLESQRGPVEKLQQVDTIGQFDQRRHVRGVKCRVGLGHHGREVVLGDRVGHEGKHHLDGRLDVVAAPSGG